MSARTAIMGRIARNLGARDGDGRAETVSARIASHGEGPTPARGRLPAEARVALFAEKAQSLSATVARVATTDDVPAAVSAYLRDHNLPQVVRRGDDPRLAAAPWENAPALTVETGRAVDADPAGLSHGFGGIAETGTLMLLSGPDNPVTLDFMPETHVVVVNAADIDGAYEDIWARFRDAGHGGGAMPRTVNWITGPSRTADIEQQIELGAHGPRRLHIVIVG